MFPAMRRLLLLLPIFLLICTSAYGQCAGVLNCTAISLSQSDISTAWNSATLDGTNLTLPAGTVTWTSQLTLTQTHSMTLLGAGAISGTGLAASISGTGSDLTTININTSIDQPVLIISTIAGKSFRMSGIAFHSLNTVVIDTGAVFLNGQSTSVRIDHNHFNQLNNVDMVFAGGVQGVIDHNQFDEGFNDENSVRITDPGWNGDTEGLGNKSWADSSHFGTGQFMYMENNNFQYTGTLGSTSCGVASGHGFAFDVGGDGGRAVFRFNAVGTHVALQTHGTSGGTQDHRGLRALIVDDNTFNFNPSVPTDCFAFLVQYEGGTGFWYNNKINGFLQYIHNYVPRINNVTYGENATPNGWGYCGTAQTGTGSNWDQSATGTGYACLDSTGRGQGDLLSGLFPSKINNTTGTIAWPHQVLEPMYVWSSPLTPVPSNPLTYFANSSGAVTVQNQDYYVQLPNQDNAATFNGTAGIGCGPVDANCTSPVTRPATCTVGVAFWNTSTSTLSKCTALNTWTNFYTPFTYPHPLVGGGPPPPTSPAPPTALAGSVSGSTISLSWTTSAGTPIPTAYTLYRGTVHNGPYVAVKSGITTTSTTDSPASGTYFYVATAFVGALISTVSGNGTVGTVICTAVCSFPSGTVFTVAGNSQAAFNGTFTSTGQPTSSTVTFSTSTNASGSGGGIWQPGNESTRSNEVQITTPATITVSIAPASLTFASTIVGNNSATQNVTVTNTSGAGNTVTFSGVSFTGTNPGDFSQTNGCGTLTTSGQSCLTVVRFTPTAPGARSALLTFVDNATGSPQTIPVSGTGVSQTPGVQLSPTSLIFGAQTVSTTSVAQSIILTNTGSGTLTITSVVASGDFAVTTVPVTNCGGTLASLATCSLNVTFTPTATGGRTGAVTVTDNAAGSPHVAGLTGTGITTKCAITGTLSLSGVASVCQ
jgi:hypothetical protein